MPPEDERSSNSSEVDFAHETDSSPSPGCPPKAGHARSHAPQPMQRSESTTGRANPSESLFIEMQPLGHFAKQAPQQQQASPSETILGSNIDGP